MTENILKKIGFNLNNFFESRPELKKKKPG